MILGRLVPLVRLVLLEAQVLKVYRAPRVPKAIRDRKVRLDRREFRGRKVLRDRRELPARTALQVLKEIQDWKVRLDLRVFKAVLVPQGLMEQPDQSDRRARQVLSDLPVRWFRRRQQLWAESRSGPMSVFSRTARSVWPRPEEVDPRVPG